MANGGYYTKGYIAELEELEKGSRWAPTYNFCQNFSARFEEAQRRLRELELNNDLQKVFNHRNIWFLNLYSNVNQGREIVIRELSMTWALYNNYEDIDEMISLHSKLDLEQWININLWLNSSDPRDIQKVISGLQEIVEDTI